MVNFRSCLSPHPSFFLPSFFYKLIFSEQYLFFTLAFLILSVAIDSIEQSNKTWRLRPAICLRLSYGDRNGCKKKKWLSVCKHFPAGSFTCFGPYWTEKSSLFVNFGSFQILRISYGMEATRRRLMTFNNKPFASFTVWSSAFSMLQRWQRGNVQLEAPKQDQDQKLWLTSCFILSKSVTSGYSLRVFLAWELWWSCFSQLCK